MANEELHDKFESETVEMVNDLFDFDGPMKDSTISFFHAMVKNFNEQVERLYNQYLPQMQNAETVASTKDEDLDLLPSHVVTIGGSIPEIYVKELEHEFAKIPVKQTDFSAGFDLHSTLSEMLTPGERMMIPTSIEVAIPEGYVGLVKPRSGLAKKFGIDTMAGVIDSDYRGQIHVILINHGTAIWKFEAGERIAQLLVVKLHPANSLTVVSELPETERGDDGFGSTGK